MKQQKKKSIKSRKTLPKLQKYHKATQNFSVNIERNWNNSYNLCKKLKRPFFSIFLNAFLYRLLCSCLK